MRRAIALFAIPLLSLFVLVGTAGLFSGHAAPEGEHEPTHNGCGIERWSVKTGTDTMARRVDTRHVMSTWVGALGALGAPKTLPSSRRAGPVELHVYVVTATIVRYRIEADSDVHLVLRGPSGKEMIAEIPSPACVGASSPFRTAISKTRTAFDARFNPLPAWKDASVQATVTGVGFFDFIHGQSGVAPNGIELHPVLKLTTH